MACPTCGCKVHYQYDDPELRWELGAETLERCAACGEVFDIEDAARTTTMIAEERQVRMAARLYEMRDTARRLLGADYAAKMSELGGALKTVADKTARQPLAVAIEAARDADGLAQCYILAAAVELAEPGCLPHNAT